MAKSKQLGVFPRLWRNRFGCKSKNCLVVVVVLVVVLCLVAVDYWYKLSKNDEEKSGLSKCNLFSGKWVFDNKSYPLYEENHCSFMAQFNGAACERAGRMDTMYQHWRWQPHHCDLPRFSAKEMLEKLRDKRLVYVGDSQARNQWSSMVCLLESLSSPAHKSIYGHDDVATFQIQEYNATIDLYWSPYLVESNSDDPVTHNFTLEQILRPNAIEKHARHWTDSDIIVFSSYLPWKRPKIKLQWGSFESPDKMYKEVDTLRAFEIVLKTWSYWLEFHINYSRTKIYFMGNSVSHNRGDLWGKDKGENCYNETEPTVGEWHHESETGRRMMEMVEATIKELRGKLLPIETINITQLSWYRKDAHTSIYRRLWGKITKQQLYNPKSYADCDNWCVPGVPDAWNELLYAYLFHF